MNQRLKQLRDLSLTEWRLLAAAIALLPLVELGLRVCGFKRTRQLMAYFLPIGPRPLTSDAWVLEKAQKTARLTAAAARHGPFKTGCLRQSLVVWWLLTRAGCQPVLRIGVRKAGIVLEAHAWVEVQGQALENGSEIATHYATLPGPAEGAVDQTEQMVQSHGNNNGFRAFSED